MEKNVKVVAKTNYSEKILKDFIKFHFRKLSLTIFICGCLIVLLGALSIFFMSLVGGIVFCIMGVFFLFYPKIIEKTSMNANKRLINAEDEYTFSKDSMHVESTIFGEQMANQDIKYQALEKVLTDNYYIYLYVNKASAMIIERSKLSEKEQNFIIENVSKAIKK